MQNNEVDTVQLSNIRRSPPSGTGKLTVGQAVEGKEDGYWYPARVLDVNSSVIKVHYDDYEDGKDNWVEPHNLRMAPESEVTLENVARKEVAIDAKLKDVCRNKEELERLRVVEPDLHFDAVAISADGKKLIFLGSESICKLVREQHHNTPKEREQPTLALTLTQHTPARRVPSSRRVVGAGRPPPFTPTERFAVLW